MLSEETEAQIAVAFDLPQPTALAVDDFVGLSCDLTVSEDGHLEIRRGHREVLQALYLRTISQKGDWIFDLDLGLPWILHERMERSWFPILGARTPDLDYLKATIIYEWSKDPRYRSAERLEISWADRARRRLAIDAHALLSLSPGGFPLVREELRVQIPLAAS